MDYLEGMALILLGLLLIVWWLAALESNRDDSIAGSVDIRMRLWVPSIPLASVSALMTGLEKISPATPNWQSADVMLALLLPLLGYAWLIRKRVVDPPLYEICIRRQGDPGKPNWAVWKDYTNLSANAARSAYQECRRTQPEYLFFLQRVGQTKEY